MTKTLLLWVNNVSIGGGTNALTMDFEVSGVWVDDSGNKHPCTPTASIDYDPETATRNSIRDAIRAECVAFVENDQSVSLVGYEVVIGGVDFFVEA